MAIARYGIPQGFQATSPERNTPHTPRRDNKNNTTENIIYIYNRASEEPNLDLECCKSAYYMALGYYPSPRIIQQMEILFSSGVCPALLVAVLEYTGEHAPRPTWAYAQCVLSRKMAEGVRSAEAFRASVDAWYRQAAATRAAAAVATEQKPPRRVKQVVEQAYSQRDYSDARFSGVLSPAEIAEAMKYAR